MSNKQPIKALSIAAGTAFVASLAMGNVANAAEGANPFAMNELSGGYMQLADNGHMGKGMEGNCGGKKGMDKDMPMGKGMDKDMPMGKGKEGKCGEGKCGGNK